jgi:hypothetical protein
MMQPASDWKLAESSSNKMFVGNRKTVPHGAVFFILFLLKKASDCLVKHGFACFSGKNG